MRGNACLDTLNARESTFAACAQAYFNGLIDALFTTGKVVYRGYVDDPRNTDNAWMETTAFHFHVTDELGAMLPLKAGDDARKARHPRDAAMAVRACCCVSNARGAPYAQVCWLTCDDSEPRFKSLYADHKMFFEQAVKGAELPHTRPTVPA